MIYVNSFWSYNFSIGIVRAKSGNQLNAPVLLAPRGMLGEGAMGLKAIKKNIFLFLSKLSGWHSNIAFHATNEQEKKDILRQFKNAKVYIAPNLNSARAINTPKTKNKGQLKLFYLSRIAKVKNLRYALEVLAMLPADILIEYDIYGNLEDQEYWTGCKELINRLPKNIKVSYKGEVSFSEVQQAIAPYHVLFLPTLNENFGHSIVESLFSGCPVIISDQTPWNDLEEHNAGYAITLDSKEKFVECIKELALSSQDEMRNKSKDAITYISNKLNVQQSIEKYKHLFNESIKN